MHNINAIVNNKNPKTIALSQIGQTAKIIRYLFKHGATNSAIIKKDLNLNDNISLLVNHLTQEPYKLVERVNDPTSRLATYKIIDHKTLADFGLIEESTS